MQADISHGLNMSPTTLQYCRCKVKTDETTTVYCSKTALKGNISVGLKTLSYRFEKNIQTPKMYKTM